MSSAALASLDALAEEKEQEWRAAERARSRALVEELEAKESELSAAETRFTTLRDDFKYNLSLLRLRDQELARYDIVCAEFKETLQLKDRACDQLREQLEKMRRAADAERLKAVQVYRYLQQQQSEWKTALASAREEGSDAARARDEAALAATLQLQTEMQSVRDAAVAEQSRLKAEQETALERATQELRLALKRAEADQLKAERERDQLSRQAQASEDKAAALSGERAALEEELRSAEKARLQAEWDLADHRHTEDARVADMEWRLQQAENRRSANVKDMEARIETIDTLLQDRERRSAAQERVWREREAALLTDQAETRAALSAARIETVAAKEALAAQEVAIREVRKEAERTLMAERERAAAAQAEHSKGAEARDAELASALQTQTQLRHELVTTREHLSAARSQVEALQQAARASSLDWEDRLAGAQRAAVETRDDLLADVTRERDAALAAASDLSEEVRRHKRVLARLQEEREQALAMAAKARSERPHTLAAANKSVAAAAEASDLARQNETLRAVIRGMREDMEALVSSHGDGDGQNYYTKEGKRGEPQSDFSPPSRPPGHDDTALRLHAVELRTETERLRLQLREATARCEDADEGLKSLQSQLNSARREVERARAQAVDAARARDDALNQLALERRSGAERRASVLAMQLGAARRDADDFAQACLRDAEEGLARVEEGVGADDGLVTPAALQSAATAKALASTQRAALTELRQTMRRLQNRVLARRAVRESAGKGDNSGSGEGVGEDVASSEIAKFENVLDENARLKVELGHASDDVRRLLEERATLLGLSNSLRAELHAARKATAGLDGEGEDSGGAPISQNTNELLSAQDTIAVPAEMQVQQQQQREPEFASFSSSSSKLANRESDLTATTTKTRVAPAAFSGTSSPPRPQTAASGVSVVSSLDSAAHGMEAVWELLDGPGGSGSGGGGGIIPEGLVLSGMTPPTTAVRDPAPTASEKVTEGQTAARERLKRLQYRLEQRGP
eukprot:UC1_evm1s720